MDKFNLKHSLKNIPVSKNYEYLIKLLQKTEDLIQRMRWKAFFFMKGSEDHYDNKITYGFKTAKNAPPVKQMDDFQADLLNLIANIKFKKQYSKFQIERLSTIRNMNNSDKIFVKADKTRNFYKMDYQKYNSLLTNNITKTYKKN